MTFKPKIPRQGHGARLLIGAFGLVCLGACGDPCRDLSDAVCNCMPTRMEQQACRRRVHNLAAQSASLSAGEKQVCQDLMQSCSCDALAQGDFKTCGLAQD